MNSQIYIDIRISLGFDDLGIFSYIFSTNHDKQLDGYYLMFQNANKQLNLFNEDHVSLPNHFERQIAVDLTSHIHRVCDCFESTIDVIIHEHEILNYKNKIMNIHKEYEKIVNKLYEFFTKNYTENESKEYLVFTNIKETKIFLKNIQEKIS